MIKVTSVDLSVSNYAQVSGTVIKPSGTSADVVYMLDSTIVGVSGAGATQSMEALEAYKCYCVGTVFAAGSGYPETWDDQPFSTSYGQTQIWKTSMAMNNTDRATVLKYEGNEWARIWKEKLIEHIIHNTEDRLEIQYLLDKLNTRNSYYLQTLFQGNHIDNPKWFFIIPLLSFTIVASIILSFFYSQFLILLLILLPIHTGIHYFNKLRVNLYINSIPQLLVLNGVAKKIMKFEFLKPLFKERTKSLEYFCLSIV